MSNWHFYFGARYPIGKTVDLSDGLARTFCRNALGFEHGGGFGGTPSDQRAHRRVPRSADRHDRTAVTKRHHALYFRSDLSSGRPSAEYHSASFVRPALRLGLGLDQARNRATTSAAPGESVGR